MPRSPLEVLPDRLVAGVAESKVWFVIGGQAVRCFAPYRPSNDADFGVLRARDLKSLVAELQRKGRVELLETSKNTTHLNFEGIDVSIFVLPQLERHVEDAVLTVTGVLATKTHAILDRGTRRDFFDLYVMLQMHGLGLLQCLEALSEVYETDVNRGLVLRALSHFDDAEAEAALPGEAADDWPNVRSFFVRGVAALVVPPTRPLGIQSRVVDVGAPLAADKRSRRAVAKAALKKPAAVKPATVKPATKKKKPPAQKKSARTKTRARPTATKKPNAR